MGGFYTSKWLQVQKEMSFHLRANYKEERIITEFGRACSLAARAELVFSVPQVIVAPHMIIRECSVVVACWAHKTFFTWRSTTAGGFVQESFSLLPQTKVTRKLILSWWRTRNDSETGTVNRVFNVQICLCCTPWEFCELISGE